MSQQTTIDLPPAPPAAFNSEPPLACSWCGSNGPRRYSAACACGVFYGGCEGCRVPLLRMSEAHVDRVHRDDSARHFVAPRVEEL